MEYVILDTDYTNRALICSCQDLDMGFFAANRRSCALLVVRIHIYTYAFMIIYLIYIS